MRGGEREIEREILVALLVTSYHNNFIDIKFLKIIILKIEKKKKKYKGSKEMTILGS